MKFRMNRLAIILSMLALTVILLMNGCTQKNKEQPDSALEKPSAFESGSVKIIENTTVTFDTTTNAKIMFKSENYLVYSVPTQQVDGSYSLVVYKHNLKTADVEYIGSIDYVGAYSNDYVSTNDSKIYTCIAYDKNFSKFSNAAGNVQMRIIEIDLTSNSILTIFEAPMSAFLAYVEYVNDNKFLIYDTALQNSETDKLYATVSIFDLSDNVMSTFITYENVLGKPIVATQDDGLVYILTYRDSQYQIEVYDLQFNIQQTINLSAIEYFFKEVDDTIKSFQYMEVKNNMFVLTSFGDSSIVFEYNEGIIIEKYVGDKLVSWDKTNSNGYETKGYSTGLESYSIDFNNNTVSLMDIPIKHRDSVVYNIYSDNSKEIFVVDTLIDKTKIYNLCKLEYPQKESMP